MELAKTYTPHALEKKWYSHWEEHGYFKPNMDSSAPSYCIQLPPPNVTGTLHMGHAFQQTIMDSLVRYHRMLGYNTLWQPGTDHAGIATQIVVERQLEQQGSSRHDLGRTEFLQKVWEWKEFSGNTITSQMRRLGASCDWSRERFTMDEGLSAAVTEVFVSLYQQGYIYRGKRLVNWDIKLQTAVSDLEVVAEEESGHLWHIRYPVKDSAESIVVATTRPETMLGDVAVAVNPYDERYQHLIGQTLLLPLVGREIPIIADEYVEAEFGTGCVKITPAHDFNDYEIGKRHNLSPINILTLDGHINQQAPLAYQGLERFACRKQIVADLEAQGLLVTVKPHQLMVPRGERTNVVIEPMLTDQWFMRMDKFAARGLELVEQGQIKFVPENWKKTYDQWLANIQDWCISRQLWWGHRIPAYYDTAGKVYVAASPQQAEQLAGTSELTQDADVLDTWFSSALWCFSTLGWPQSTAEMNAFLPSSVLVTGFDIIFFWVARMIMLTEHFTGEIPFKDVYINGLIMDAHGNKMSKSKGNIIDPLDIIDGISLDELVIKRTANLMNPKQADSIAKQTRKDYPDGFLAFGADALRFALASLATQARYINFDVKRIEGSRNFCNKLFNATKFVLMQVTQQQSLLTKPAGELGLIEHWIRNKLSDLITNVTNSFSSYRFDLACQHIYEFVWNEFCDWYLELAKVNLHSEHLAVRTATLHTLLEVLEAVLRLAHPIIPFLTEELWQAVAPLANQYTHDSIMLASYPQASQFKLSEVNYVDTEVEQLKTIVTAVRNLRAEMGLAPAATAPLVIEIAEPDTLANLSSYVLALAKVSQLEIVEQLGEVNAPVAVIPGARLMLKVAIDVAAETNRLQREIEKQRKEADKLLLKLANPQYIERAPRELVERDQTRAGELNAVIQHLQQQLTKLSV